MQMQNALTYGNHHSQGHIRWPEKGERKRTSDLPNKHQIHFPLGFFIVKDSMMDGLNNTTGKK